MSGYLLEPEIVAVRLLNICGAGVVTVSIAVPDSPSTSAVIVAEPACLPSARPDELTVATVVLLLVHVKVLPDISVLSDS